MIITLLGLCVITTFIGMFSAIASDGCYDNACNETVMEAGYYTALLAPWAVAVLAIVFTVIRLVRRKIAFWIPLVGMAGAIGALLLGLGLVSASLP